MWRLEGRSTGSGLRARDIVLAAVGALTVLGAFGLALGFRPPLWPARTAYAEASKVRSSNEPISLSQAVSTPDATASDLQPSCADEQQLAELVLDAEPAFGAAEAVSRAWTPREGGTSPVLPQLRQLRDTLVNLTAVAFTTPSKDRLERRFSDSSELAVLGGGMSTARCRRRVDRSLLAQKVVEGWRTRIRSYNVFLSEDPLGVSSEVEQVQELLNAFFELPLMSAPAPERCELPLETDFLYQREPLEAALAQLSSGPFDWVVQLRKGPVAEGGDASLTSSIANGVCEQLENIVCHLLNQARRPIEEPSSVPGLRSRGESLAGAVGTLRKLRSRASEIGCGGRFGVEPAERYADQLLVDLEQTLDRSVARWESWIDESAKSTRGGRPDEHARALHHLQEIRLELVAWVTFVVEPALAYLSRSEISEDKLKRWRAVVAELESGPSNVKTDESGLHAFEKVYVVLLRRPREVCALIRAPWARAAFESNEGVFTVLGKQMLMRMGKRCAEGG